ncbi:MAG: tRNA (adenosine(37)-N6)-threonylcarbamoyltransferase complex ATPase subunit type 1 TsaE [Nitrospirae bacterium]|nr:tRNA (adenosine(37)-N6)-threonylcarbamoyltransferase complex ATPase subunit type 1 TsaE [Nitrospirota bacterium]
MIEIISQSPQQTVAIGQRLGRLLKSGQSVLITGEFGCGKTTLIKGIARQFELPPEAVTSASFTIIAEHDTPIPFYHIDLYRLTDIDSIFECGVFECLGGEGVAVIEWADRLDGYFKGDIYITMTHCQSLGEESQRRLIIEGIDEKDWNNL